MLKFLSDIVEAYVRRRTPPVSRDVVAQDIQARNDRDGWGYGRILPRGNVALGAGCFVTAADLEAEREENRKIRF